MMYWFSRPPYLRWAAAAVVLLAALYVEFRPEASTLHPFLTADVPAGTAIAAADLEWRNAPAGLLPMPDLAAAVAGADLRAGEPLLPSQLGAPWAPPPGWWAVPLPVPVPAAPGTPVQVVVVDQELTVAGIVVETPPPDPFAFAGPALVAVPGEWAAGIAVAAARNGVVVLVTP